MRSFLLAVFALFILSFGSKHTIKNSSAKKDTAAITHTLDGLVDEWPADKFTLDEPTHIKYAVDNDAQNLYVAMVVPEFGTQIKMMRNGMELYLDVKGKKKEGKGVEFPVKGEPMGGGFNSGNQMGNQQNNGTGERGSFDKKAMRSRYALNLLALKLFGFTDDPEPQKQGLTQEGSVNISFSWD